MHVRFAEHVSPSRNSTTTFPPLASHLSSVSSASSVSSIVYRRPRVSYRSAVIRFVGIASMRRSSISIATRSLMGFCHLDGSRYDCRGIVSTTSVEIKVVRGRRSARKLKTRCHPNKTVSQVQPQSPFLTKSSCNQPRDFRDGICRRYCCRYRHVVVSSSSDSSWKRDSRVDKGGVPKRKSDFYLRPG